MHHNWRFNSKALQNTHLQFNKNAFQTKTQIEVQQGRSACIFKRKLAVQQKLTALLIQNQWYYKNVLLLNKYQTSTLFTFKMKMNTPLKCYFYLKFNCGLYVWVKCMCYSSTVIKYSVASPYQIYNTMTFCKWHLFISVFCMFH